MRAKRGITVIYQHDLELRAEDIQVLNDADGVAALFSRLGYETNARTVQSPGNLGITADTLLRRIKKIELIANNEGFFQVYLFQLVSVTVVDARAARNELSQPSWQFPTRADR